MSEVVGLRSGKPLHHEGNPDPNVVEACENLLEMARSGEIIGVAFVTLSIDNSTGEGYSGQFSRGMVGGLFAVSTRMSVKMLGL